MLKSWTNSSVGRVDGVQTKGVNIGQQSFVAKQAKVSEDYNGYDRHTKGV